MPLLYEEQWGPFARRVERLRRLAAWRAKGALRVRRRILVEICWRLGDEIMALPIYAALRAAHPDAHVSVRCNFPELLENNPHVDAVNEAAPAPDRYINLRSGPRFEPRMEHYARLAGVPAPAETPRLYFEDWSTPLLDALPKGPRPLVAIAAESTWPTKQWPVRFWQALCSELHAAGYTTVALGRAGQPPGAEVSLLGATTVREAACVLRAARLLISSDSGLMHLALAAGTPVVALFGPTAPAFLVRTTPLLHVLANGRPCQGCWNRPGVAMREGECPLGIPECLGTIAPEKVAATAQMLLTEAQ